MRRITLLFYQKGNLLRVGDNATVDWTTAAYGILFRLIARQKHPILRTQHQLLRPIVATSKYSKL